MVSTLLAAASSTFWSMSQSATSSTLGWPVISLMWSLPRPRRPMVATRMVSFGLPKTVVEAAAAAAVVRKKFRRSIGFVIAIRRLLYHNSGDFRSASPKSTQEPLPARTVPRPRLCLTARGSVRSTRLSIAARCPERPRAPGNASPLLPILVNLYRRQRAFYRHGGGEVAAGIERGHAPNAGRRGAGAVEARSMSLQQRFEARPMAEKLAHTGGRAVACWKVALRNRRVLRQRTDALDIHAYLSIERHRHQRHFARMRQIEADLRRLEKVRLALFVEREFKRR